jgi:hypothetical protein
MRVASKNQGGPSYSGPLRLYPPRWNYIDKFYVIELSSTSYYMAQSLTHHPHYSILRSEAEDFEVALREFHSKRKSTPIIRITSTENFDDNFLIVINDFKMYPLIQNYVSTIDDDDLFSELNSQAKIDKNRGNFKIDFGYACGQNLQRHSSELGATKPRILDRSLDPVFLNVQVQLSVLSDLVCQAFNLQLFHRLDNIHQEYCSKLHPNGIIPSWRTAFNGPNQYLEVHEDTNNEARPLMSPVGVFSRIYLLDDKKPIRLTKIGYSRQSIRDCIIRQSIIAPVVHRFKEWESNQPPIMSEVSSQLFQLPPNSPLPSVIEFPCHLERCVGISPYIHATIELQKRLDLSKQQCIALLYNCITNESPFFSIPFTRI